MKKQLNYQLVSSIKEDLYEVGEKIEKLDFENRSVSGELSISGQLETEINQELDVIEGKIEQVSKKNIKEAIIKNVKIALRFVQLVIPFVIAFGATTALFYFLGDIPFYPEQEFFYKHHETTFDTLGNEEDKESFISTNLTDVHNTAYFSTKWEQKDDGKYYRTIRQYDFTEYTLDELKEMINDPNLNYEQAFGKAKGNSYIAKKELDEGDSTEKPYVQVIFRYNDDEDIILRGQDMDSNLIYGFLWLLLNIILDVGILAIRSDCSMFDFGECVRDLKRKYRKEDVEALKKLLEEKKITINRVARTDEKYQELSNGSSKATRK